MRKESQRCFFLCMAFHLVITKCEAWAYSTCQPFFLRFLSILYKYNCHIIILKMLFIQIQNERLLRKAFSETCANETSFL